LIENKNVNRKLKKGGVVISCHERTWFHIDQALIGNSENAREKNPGQDLVLKTGEMTG